MNKGCRVQGFRKTDLQKRCDSAEQHKGRSITCVQGAKGLAAYIAYDQVAKASESQGRRDPTKILTIATSHVEYSTANRHYAHVDCPTIQKTYA